MNLKNYFFVIIVLFSIFISNCANHRLQVQKNCITNANYQIDKNTINNLWKFGTGVLALTISAYMAYDKYYCNKRAFTIFNQNTFICSKNMKRLKSYFFLIDKLFKAITTGTKKSIITLQEFPNYKKFCDYAKTKAEVNRYYFFSSPAGRRIKKNSKEKLCCLVIMLDKNRFEVSEPCIYKDCDEHCKNVFAITAKDKITNEDILIINVKAAISSESRKELSNKFQDIIYECKKKFNKKFSKIIAPGDYNAFGDDNECKRESYLNNFKVSMQSKSTPYFYSPFDLNEMKVSFFPDWSDGIIRKPILESLEELKKFEIEIYAYELSHIGNIIYNNINQDAHLEKILDLKKDLQELAFTKEKTLLKNVIQDIQKKDKISEISKQLFINTISKIEKTNLQDIILTKKEIKAFIIFNALQKICARFENPSKLDMVNISSKYQLTTQTDVPNQLIKIDDLLACHDDNTKKILKEKIIFRNKLMRYIPKPSGFEWLDDDEMIEKYTLVSDHFSNITTVKKKSLISKILDIVKIQNNKTKS